MLAGVKQESGAPVWLPRPVESALLPAAAPVAAAGPVEVAIRRIVQEELRGFEERLVERVLKRVKQ